MESLLSYQCISQQKPYRSGEKEMIYSKCRKKKNWYPRMFYLAKLSFSYEGGIKTFLDKNKNKKIKLSEFIITRPSCKKC